MNSVRSIRLAAGLALGLASASSAQTLSWNNANGGSAATATNWTPNAVPGAANDLVFNIATALPTMPISFTAATVASKTHTYRQESVTLTASSPHAASGSLIVGSLAGDNATLVLTTGTLTFNASSLVGNAAGSIGAVTVNDDDADLLIAGATSDFTVGVNGDAALSVTGGGLVNVGRNFFLGSNSTSSPTLTVSGQLGVFPFTTSSLIVQGTGESRFGQGGDATVSISSGGQADIAGSLVISNGSASTSTVVIGGLGLVAKATLDVANDVLIGRNSSASPAGIATLTVNDDGALLVGDTLMVGGDPEGGTGTLVLNAGGSIDVASLSLGAGGTLDLNGGTLDIDSGTLSATGQAAGLVLGGPSNPIVTMRTNATASLPKGAGANALMVGGGTAGADLADFDVRSGSDLSILAGDVILGSGATDDGSMIINGVGSTFVMQPADDLRVGDLGSAHFEVELGASATVGNLFVAAQVGSDGEVLIEGPGSLASIQFLAVGGSTGILPGGSAMFVVSDQAVVTLQPNIETHNVFADGSLVVLRSAELLGGATLFARAGGEIAVDDDAIVDVEQVNLDTGSTLRLNMGGFPSSGVARVSSRIDAKDGSVIEVGEAGAIIGDPSSVVGFEAESDAVLALNGNALIIQDLGNARLGTVTLTDPASTQIDGVLDVPGGSVLGPFCSLSGNGNVFGEFFIDPGSAIHAEGGTGITFRDAVECIDGGATFTGNRISFNFGGTFKGQGTMPLVVLGDAQCSIRATGPLTMGTSAPVGYSNLGELHTGGHAVVLVDGNGVVLGSLTELQGGSIAQSVLMNVPPGNVVQGTGTLSSPTVEIFGMVKPGDLTGFGPDLDLITVSGALKMTNSTYLCHLGPGVEFPTSDRIQTSGAAKNVTITDGTLEVQILPGYTPQPADIFDVIVATGAVTGSFQTLVLPPKAGVRYLSNRVRVHFCYADCESDGDLDVFDFLCFQNFFGSGNLTADCELDGDLDVFDFLCFQNEFGVGCGF